MSAHHYFAIFLFAINAAIATVASISDLQAPSPPKVDYLVDFELTLDVETLKATSYDNFITKLRTELAKEAQSSGTVPILPNYGNRPHLFDVVLTTSNHNARIRCRRDNLYVRGYLTKIKTKNQWMEFNEGDGLHMVDKSSEFLPFGGSYRDLGNQAGSKVTVTNINYNKIELKKAADTLALPTDAKDYREKRGKSLIIMAQMISEAARFVDVSTHFARDIETATGGKLPNWMFTQLEQSWSKLSRVVQCSDKWKGKYKYTPVTINNAVYDTAEKLGDNIFGVMLKENLSEKNCEIKKLADEDEGEAVVSADM